MQNTYRCAEIPARPESFTREIGAVMNNFPSAWAQHHNLTLPVHPRCAPSAQSCARGAESSSNPRGAVQGREGTSRLPRATARLTRPQAPVRSPRLGGLFPWAVSTGQAVYLAALVLRGWARRKVPRTPLPLPPFWEGRRPASRSLLSSSWSLPTFCPWMIFAAECGWGRGGRGWESTLKKRPMEHICYQAPGAMPFVWLGWWRSSAHQMFTRNPQVCKGRNLPSVSQRALKMPKNAPPNLNPKERLSPWSAPAGGKEGKKRESGWDASGVLTFGGEHAAILPLHPDYSAAQHSRTGKVFYEEQSNVQW